MERLYKKKAIGNLGLDKFPLPVLLEKSLEIHAWSLIWKPEEC